MPFQPAPACAQVVMRYVHAGTGLFGYANVLNFRSVAGTAYTAAQLADLAAVLDSWDDTYNKVLRSTAWSLGTMVMRGLDSAEAAFHTETVNRPGTAAGEDLPLNVAAVITLITAFTGRSARGRIYHGGLSEVQTGGSTLTAGVITGMNAAYAELLSTLDGEGFDKLVVLSRTNAGVDREVAVPFDVTSAVLRDSILDTQSRRINRLK